MYTIAGSGFGLYGYLPALTRHLGKNVVLPSSYREKVESRPELADCLSRITWARDKAQALAQATAVVIALPPSQQAETAATCARLANVETVVLEKPVAETPAKAALVHEQLRSAGKRTVVNYSFLYLPWFDQLSGAFRAGTRRGPLGIEWKFKAHHFQNHIDNWKRAPLAGGGPVRFYGIHIIAVLADLGYDSVASSTLSASGGETESVWRAGFTKKGAAPAEVLVDSNASDGGFTITGDGETVRLSDPFDDPRANSGGSREDRRVPVIVRMLQSDRHAGDEGKLYPAVISLWEAVEGATRSL